MQPHDSVFLSVNEGYNRWAEFYDADDIPLHLLEEPLVDAALGDITKLRILDVGCGTGRETLRLAKTGAVMIGIDQSEGMLSQAKKKVATESVTFIQADADKRFPFESYSFDRVVSFLALEHFTDLKFTFSECRRVCLRDGFIFLTAMHPAMTLKGVQARYTDKFGQKCYPKSFPYQISDYLNAATDAGLRLFKISEHATDASHAKVSERAQKYEGWPLLLTLKFSPL